MERPVITTDAEAWAFLMTFVKPNGEFRIHTNKTGIRVFVSFNFKPLTGYDKQYIARFRKDQVNPPYDTYFNRDRFEEYHALYETTITGATLAEVVQLIVVDLPMNKCMYDVFPNAATHYAQYQHEVVTTEEWENEYLERPQLKT